MNLQLSANKPTYVGLFLVALATLMYEILLTRIFSVTMWYHFAFVAISVAMFGMTVGALWVYLHPTVFAASETKYQLAQSSLLFAITTVVSFMTQLLIPFAPRISLLCLSLLALIYAVVSVPFIFAGVCVCLALTKFPAQVSRLYAADLMGAATGCLLLIATLRLSDAPTAIFVVGFVASTGAILLAIDAGSRKLRNIAALTSFVLATFIGVNTRQAGKQNPLIRLTWVKGTIEATPLYEKWNSFARITVKDDPARRDKPFGWGLSPSYRSGGEVRQLFLNIDASAETVLTGFQGDLASLDYLKFDVTNIAHYIRPNARVLVVGSGGGRDILSALTFGQQSIVAVEINEEFIKALNGRFGSFTGHLDRNPKVSFVNDEARSYIARSRNQVDIIQVSLIDTWAATAAGAFVLSENSLYTLEGWNVLLKRLSPDGVLTFSRWYSELPGQMYRLTALASASLLRLGIDHPEKRIVIVRCMKGPASHTGVDEPRGVATILVSKEPFSNRDLDTLEAITRKMGFEPVFSPRFAPEGTFSTLASGKDLDRFTASFPIDISPPADDRPFFFNTTRLQHALNPAWWNPRDAEAKFSFTAIFILASLLGVVSCFTLVCIILPLALAGRKQAPYKALPYFIYFAAIGLGFMLVEISQMQRLIVFLGHPVYGLSVVLFALLLSSGIGSYLTEHAASDGHVRSASVRLGLLIGVLIIFGVLTPHFIHAFAASSTPRRIVTATAILFPLGLTMGTAFPIGLKLASKRSPSLTPWLWGINGATSVCASVLAVVIAMAAGISASFWTGCICYAAALGTILWASREQHY